MEERLPPPETQPKKSSKLEKLNRGTKRNSESLGICLSVIATWLITDVFVWDIPMEVMGAIFTAMGIVAARFRDSLF